MREIFKLALRNLKEHKSKTIIIACFLMFGVAIVILGNSFLESVNRGLEKDFRANYTGDIAIGKNPEKGVINDIFGVNSTNITTELPQLPAIPELDKVMEIVNSTDGIKSQTKLISAQILVAYGVEMDLSDLVDRDDLGFDDMPISMLFAGENDSYWDTFTGVNFVEGTYPAPGTNEIMVDTRVKKAYESLYSRPLNIGDTVLCAGASSSNILREAKVVGVFNPPNENSAMFQIVYCNPDFARAFADLTYASNFENQIPDTIDLSIAELDEDDMFSSFDDDLFAIDDTSMDFLGGGIDDFDSILGDTTLRDQLNKTDEGAWHYILMKAKNPLQTNAIIAELNQKFKEAGLDVYAMDWKAAAYSYSGSVEGIGLVFNILIIILAIVVFIIIMNTMIVSVIERTGEIGTMRAIGAERKFVRRLFFSETFFLTSISSLAGVILSFIIMAIFNSLNITITNSIAKMILGGGLLRFSPTVGIILCTIIIAVGGSVLSNLYPVSSALKITPLKALNHGGD
ncbi:MAG: FtsX-like permease family protein [Treponema sp.]|nr:FtsX-like permease family protein [Treponema sp.]